MLLSGDALAADLVTLSASDWPIRKILEEVSRQSGLIVVSSQPLSETKSTAFYDLPVAQAVNRLLQGRSYVLIQNIGDGGRAELWVLDRAPGSTTRTWRYDPGVHAVAERTMQGIRSEPAALKSAIETLAELGGTGSIDQLAGLLSHPDRSVRAHAVDALGDIGGACVVPYLQRMTADADPYVREAAFDYLAELGE